MTVNASTLASPPGTLRQTIRHCIDDWFLDHAAVIPDYSDDASLLSLGMDSVAAAEITLKLEAALDITLADDVVYDHPTVAELQGYLLRHAAPASPSEHTSAPVPVRGAGSTPLIARAIERNARTERLRAAGEYWFHPVITDQGGSHATLDGQRCLILGSYSYLGLIGDSRLRDAAIRGAETLGPGTHGVRVLAGTTASHVSLERELAEFCGQEDCLVYSSGYVANLATITALVGPGDVVIGDVYNHASIIDGCRYSGAEFHEFRHNDVAHLDELLTAAAGRTALVIVDGIYSMEGDVVPVPDVARICRRHGATLMIDEAHAHGVLGPGGRGTEAYFGLAAGTVDLTMGLLSKAFGSIGGFVSASRPIIEFLRHHARGYLFSGALPAPQIEAAREALRILRSESWRVDAIHQRKAVYLAALRREGLTVEDRPGAVIPIMTRTEEITMAMTRLCRARGLFVVPVIYPAVPMNAPRLRTCMLATHTDDDMVFAASVIADAARAAGLLPAA